MIIERINTYKFFAQQGIELANKDVLDFGCNRGNLLWSCGETIDPNRYIGIDCCQDALEAAAQDFPGCDWVHTNRANPLYNPDGVGDYGDAHAALQGRAFDYVLAYSVFSHMSLEDIQAALALLVPHLKSGGKLVASWCPIDSATCVDWFRQRRANCDPIDASLDFSYLVESVATPTPPTRCDQFVSFFRQSYLQAQLATYAPTFADAPRPEWLQHVLVIQAP